MATPEAPLTEQCGREITARDIEHIEEVVRLCSGLSRDQLTHTICEHRGWITATGKHKTQGCMKLFSKLEDRGELRLPAKRSGGSNKHRRAEWTERTASGPEITGPLAEVRPVTLEMVTDRSRDAAAKQLPSCCMCGRRCATSVHNSVQTR